MSSTKEFLTTCSSYPKDTSLKSRHS